MCVCVYSFKNPFYCTSVSLFLPDPICLLQSYFPDKGRFITALSDAHLLALLSITQTRETVAVITHMTRHELASGSKGACSITCIHVEVGRLKLYPCVHNGITQSSLSKTARWGSQPGKSETPCRKMGFFGRVPVVKSKHLTQRVFGLHCRLYGAMQLPFYHRELKKMMMQLCFVSLYLKSWRGWISPGRVQECPVWIVWKWRKLHFWLYTNSRGVVNRRLYWTRFMFQNVH